MLLGSFIIYTKVISTCSESVSFHALHSAIANVTMSQDAIVGPTTAGKKYQVKIYGEY